MPNDSMHKRQGDTVSDWEKRLASIIEKTSRNLPKSDAPVTSNFPSDEQLNRRLAAELVCYPQPRDARELPLQACNSTNPPLCAISARAATRTIVAREEMTKQIESSVRKSVAKELRSKLLDIERAVGQLQQQEKFLREDDARLSGELFSMTKKFDTQYRAMSGLRRRIAHLEKSDRSEEDDWRCRIESDMSHLVSSAELRKAVDRARLAATSAVTKAISPLQAQVECSLQTVHLQIAEIKKKLVERSPCECDLTELSFVDFTRTMDQKLLQLRKQVMEEMDQSRRHILSTVAADAEIRNRGRLYESPEYLFDTKAVKDSIEGIVERKVQERESKVLDAVNERLSEIEKNIEGRILQTIDKKLSSSNQQLYDKFRSDVDDQLSEISRNMEQKLSRKIYEDQTLFNQDEQERICDLKGSVAASVMGEISNKLASSHQQHQSQIRDELLQYFGTEVKPKLATLSIELSKSIRLDVEPALTRKMEEDLKHHKEEITNALSTDLNKRLSAQLRSGTADLIEDEVCQRLDSRLSPVQMRPMFMEAAEKLVNEKMTNAKETLCETVKAEMAHTSEKTQDVITAQVKEQTIVSSTRMMSELHDKIGELKKEAITSVSSQLRKHINDEMESQSTKDSVAKTVRTILDGEFIPMLQGDEVRSHLIDLVNTAFRDRLRPLQHEMQHLKGTLKSQADDIDAIERTCGETRQALLARYDTLETSSEQWRTETRKNIDEYACAQLSDLSEAKAQTAADLEALKESFETGAAHLKQELQDLTSKLTTKLSTTDDMQAKFDACMDVVETFCNRVAAVEEEGRTIRASVKSMEAEVRALSMAAQSKPETPADARHDPPGGQTRGSQGDLHSRESCPRSGSEESDDLSIVMMNGSQAPTESSIRVEEAAEVGGEGTEMTTATTRDFLGSPHAAAAAPAAEEEEASSPWHRAPSPVVGAGESSESVDSEGCVATTPKPSHLQSPAPRCDSPTEECVSSSDREETSYSSSSTVHPIQRPRDGAVSSPCHDAAPPPATGRDDDSAGCDVTTLIPPHPQTESSSPDPSVISGSPIPKCIGSFGAPETASFSSSSSSPPSSCTVRSSEVIPRHGEGEPCAPHEGPTTGESHIEGGDDGPAREVEESEGDPLHATNRKDAPVPSFADDDDDGVDLGSITQSAGEYRSTSLDAAGEDGPSVLIESITNVTGLVDEDSVRSRDDDATETESGFCGGDGDDHASSCTGSTEDEGSATSQAFSHSDRSGSLTDCTFDDTESVCSMLTT